MTTPHLFSSRKARGREQPRTDSNGEQRLFSGRLATDPVDDPAPPIGDPPDDDQQDEPFDDENDDEDEDDD